MKNKKYVIIKIINTDKINNKNNSNKKKDYDFIKQFNFKKNVQNCEKDKYKGFIDSDYSELQYNE